MTIEELVETIKKSKQHSCLYHFTDASNRPSIKKHGILSSEERQNKNIKPDFCGGNERSQDADISKGITNYVSLSFTKDHPLCYLAKCAGRLPNPIYLKICLEVLLIDGVMFANGVANANATYLMPMKKALEKNEIDLDVIYKETDWKDPVINNRLQTARKTEILVPNCVPQTLFLR